jgi:hypothetical protein
VFIGPYTVELLPSTFTSPMVPDASPQTDASSEGPSIWSPGLRRQMSARSMSARGYSYEGL